MTTMKQPFQCNLQPEIQEPHRTTHTDTTTRCKRHRKNNSRMKRPQPQPPHSGGTFHRRLQPLYTEKHKVSCSLRLPPQNRTLATSCTTPLHGCQFPSSPLPFVTTSLCHHFPSSPLPFVTTPSLSPPFIKVNSTASYSFVVYCYVMHCYVIYHPSSRSIPPLHCHHPSSRSIPPLLILVLCIVM